MARIGLLDLDGKQVNLALMKLSTHHRRRGDTVLLRHFTPDMVDRVYISVLYDRNRAQARQLAQLFPNVEIGGTGWDLTTTLPAEVEACRPDYDLYHPEDIYVRLRGIMTKQAKRAKAETIVRAGIGFLSRGCPRRCAFCVVPRKEGCLHRVGTLDDCINPRSSVVTLLDSNLTANPDILEILAEIKARNLMIDLTQGLDIRSLTPKIAAALQGVRFLRSIHYAWDEMPSERAVLRGIETLARFIPKSKHLCFMLVGYNTLWDEDYYRFHRLVHEIRVDPYAMIFHPHAHEIPAKTRHFARWVNSRIYTACSFRDYEPWLRARQQLAMPVTSAA